MSQTRWPTANIEWSAVLDSYDVDIVRTPKGGNAYYVVTLPDGSRAVALWGGRDARRAQARLDALAAKTQARRANAPRA